MERRNRGSQGVSTLLVIAALIAVALGGGIWWWLRSANASSGQALQLTPDARQYVSAGNLPLSEVEMKATASYVGAKVVEILGKIGNKGDRGIDTVELFCVFYDPYGQVVLRRRMAIVRERNGGLKPGETKSFRLPFDDIPDSWNQQMPQLVIAGIRFSS